MNLFAIGATIMGALCILCLTISMGVLFKSQEVYSRCVEILYCAHNWLEQCRHEQEDSKDV